MTAAETIAAVATPPGKGGVGIVRVSGPAAAAVAEAVLGRRPTPRYAEYAAFRDAAGEVLDQGLALFFPGPHSFTGEDVLELQGHGGPVVMDRLLAAVTAAGARVARPGEFSQRAFLNGKLDLAQAEAVADLIDASSEQAARSALRSLDGAFSGAVTDLAEAVTDLRVYVEAAIDFPEDEVDFLAEGQVAERLAELRERLAAVQAQARAGAVLREGMTVVLAGRPNVGKSSLLNALAGRETAIVTEVPGTTRDLLREHLDLDGLPLHVIDTAGLRESGDPIEQEGVRRAWDQIAAADRLLLVVEDAAGIGDAERSILERLPADLPRTVVRNKVDRTGRAAGLEEGADGTEVALCARTGEGVERLKRHLQESMGYAGGEGAFAARRRHLEALAEAADHLEAGAAVLAQDHAGELLAEELRSAHAALGAITGAFTSEDLLDRIFAGFCIGK